jgi:hypothetical protein
MSRDFLLMSLSHSPVEEFDAKSRLIQACPLPLASTGGERGLRIVDVPNLRELGNSADFGLTNP